MPCYILGPRAELSLLRYNVQVVGDGTHTTLKYCISSLMLLVQFRKEMEKSDCESRRQPNGQQELLMTLQKMIPREDSGNSEFNHMQVAHKKEVSF